MHRYFGGYYAYDLFNLIGYYLMIFTNLLYYKSKKDAMSLFSEKLIYASSKSQKDLGTVVQAFLFVIETVLASICIDQSTRFNGSFGEMVGTGRNYFALLIFAPIFISLFSIVLVINPIKELDVITMGLPVFLFFVKLACFFNGCCWGIPWEHGPYNYHHGHPGNQVPIQLFEALFAALILLILLIYRKKAKPGTIYPMYLTLYSFTRFFSEFFAAAYPDVLGPFNMYQILCAIGFVVGIILLIFMNIFGERISDFFEKPHKKFHLKMLQKEEQQAIMIAEAKAKAEAEEIERKEKVRLAREKAKARKE